MNSLSECLQYRFGDKRRPIFDASAPVPETPRVDAEGVLCLVQQWSAPDGDGEPVISFRDFLGRRFTIDAIAVLSLASIIPDYWSCGDLYDNFDEFVRKLIEARRDEWWTPAAVFRVARH